MFGRTYDIVRRITPFAARQWLKRRRWFMPLTKVVIGADAYSASYYDDVELLENESVGHIADWILERLNPARAIDVGCGPGHLMRQLQSRGVEIYGVDVSAEAIRRTRANGLKVERHDLTRREGMLPGAPYDLAISCEVAEHLEERFANTFVGKLSAASPVVFFTAAEPVPGSGIGLFHHNEQIHAWWIELFHCHGFDLDRTETENARSYLHKHGVISYLANPLVLRRRNCS